MAAFLATQRDWLVVEVIAGAWHGIERIRVARHLTYSFLRHAGLSVS